MLCQARLHVIGRAGKYGCGSRLFTVQLMWVLTLLLAAMPEMADTLSASEVSSFRFESPAVQTISSERIASVASGSVPDVLRYVSGIQIKDYGGLGGLKTVNVRSLGSQHTGIFLDGIRLNNIQNGQVDLGRYSAEDLESVSVFNAGSSSALQSASEQASSSTVYLKSRFPDFSRPYTIEARGGYGSFNTGSGYLSLSKRLGRKTYLKLLGDYRHTDGDYPFTYVNSFGADTTEIRKNSALSSFHIEPSFYYKSANSRLHLKGYWFHSDRGLPGPVIRQGGQVQNGDSQRDDNIFVQGNYGYSEGAFSLKILGKYAYDYCNYLQDTTGNKSVRYKNLHYYQQEGYLSAAAAWKYGNFTFSLAWDNIADYLESDVAGFSDRFRWSSLLASGIRFRYRNLSATGSLVYNHSRDNSGLLYNKVSPFLSFQYSPGHFRFLLYWKNSFRLPTFNELYYVSSPSSNTAHILNPETVDQFDLTAAYSTGARIWSCDFRIDGFYNITRDKIVWIPAANQFVWSAFNYGLVRGYGWTVSADNRFGFGGLSVSALINYTYERSKDLSDPASEWYGGQIAYIPLHSVSSTVSADWKTWSFSANFIYNSVRYRASANIAANLLKPYANLDLMLSKKLFGFMKVSAAVNNATDSSYEIVSRYPMPGINYRLMLQLNF